MQLRDSVAKARAAAVEQRLRDQIDVFTPLAKGGEDGASWKLKLTDVATFDVVKKQAGKNLLKLDGKEMVKMWKTLVGVRDEYEKCLKRNIDMGVKNVDDSLLKTSAELVLAGRVTLCEAIIMNKPDDKATISKQIGELQKLNPTATDMLHPAIYDIARATMKAKR